MYSIRNITDDVVYVGVEDRRLHLFENIFPLDRGVTYNAYVIRDEKTALLDTADATVSRQFFENVAAALDGRALDYLIVNHMEPDHCALIAEALEKYPQATVVGNAKTFQMITQFFALTIPEERKLVVKEGDTLSLGKHQLSFVMAPMVHWPEVMFSYDATEGILFSADAFGVFGTNNGNIFADELDYKAQDFVEDARRYYTNIVGKYGMQVQNVLKKAAGIDIRMLCPLHGFVWRRDIEYFFKKYNLWSTYTPEEKGVMIAYASIYGNTENAAEILSSKLRERGVRTVMYDVSVTPASEIIAECFRWSHLVFASSTYNGGVFVTMDELLRDIAAHNLQKRTVAFMENGTWAPVSARQMTAIFAPLKNMTVLEQSISIRSSLTEGQLAEIEALADVLAEDIR